MKSDLLIAIAQLAAEKGLPKEVIISAMETALVAALKKSSFTANHEVSVKLVPQSGGIVVH
ncbi:MAG: transcription termination/antitermination protein NusA, partial [Dehalococcoidia bacterium]|nr:transcription termination/antitermination protein NusA [Dehalococcoidia bacterium]